MYPGLAASVATEGWLPAAESDRLGLLMAREVIGLAQPFLTTSEYAAALARSDARPQDAERVGVLPYAYPAVVDRDELAVQDGLICAFGVVNESKRPTLVVEAVARLAATRPCVRLAFVGPASDAERHRIETLAETLDVRDRVEVTGLVDEAAYEGWLGRAALAVQLRAFSNGETSGAVADCLTHGVATIVSDLGPARAFPEGCVERLPLGADPRQLVDVIVTLLDDPARRQALGREARHFVAGYDFGRAAEDLLGVIDDRSRTASAKASRH
jgi:glycosyltransferase involved in cell wall biosynthesis